MTDLINLHGDPLSIYILNQISCALATDGEVHVVNCARSGPGHVACLFHLMSNKLSNEDKEWLRGMVREELRGESEMTKLVAEQGKINKVATFKADGIGVTFNKAALATTGDIGEVRIAADSGQIIMSFAQAVSLANEILKRCQD
jgi:uncharacterized membrane protein